MKVNKPGRKKRRKRRRVRNENFFLLDSVKNFMPTSYQILRHILGHLPVRSHPVWLTAEFLL